MTKQSTAICPHCDKPVSDYLKTNRYHYSDFVKDPVGFREEYIASADQEAYDIFIEEYNDVIEKNELDETYFWLEDLPSFTLSEKCLECGQEIFLAEMYGIQGRIF